jgi:hypothetical protein
MPYYYKINFQVKEKAFIFAVENNIMDFGAIKGERF